MELSPTLLKALEESSHAVLDSLNGLEAVKPGSALGGCLLAAASIALLQCKMTDAQALEMFQVTLRGMRDNMAGLGQRDGT